MEKNKIQAAVEGTDIIIRVSIDDLVFVVENDPEYSYKVINKERFAKEICFELENSRSFRNQDGMNAMEEMFQNAYEKVAEQGDDEIMTSEPINFNP